MTRRTFPGNSGDCRVPPRVLELLRRLLRVRLPDTFSPRERGSLPHAHQHQVCRVGSGCSGTNHVVFPYCRRFRVVCSGWWGGISSAGAGGVVFLHEAPKSDNNVAGFVADSTRCPSGFEDTGSFEVSLKKRSYKNNCRKVFEKCSGLARKLRVV